MTLPKTFQIEGVSNFRDQGGYKAGGGTIALDGLYRSGHFADITDSGIESLAALGLNRIIDLRDDHERDGFPSRPLGVTTEPHGGRLFEFANEYDGHPQTEDEVKARKINAYRRFHTRFHSGAGAVYGALARGEKVLVHCTSGKDRTGFMGALLLRLLGAAEADIQADYMVSQAASDDMDPARKAAIIKFYGYDASQAHIVDVQRKIFPELVMHALQAMEETHGSAENYLTGPCGLSAADITAIKDRFI